MFAERKAEEERVGKLILDAAMRVHSAFGPGLLEGAYEACLANDLEGEGLEVHRQVTLPIEYLGRRVEGGYRIDLVVGQLVVVEVKAVEKIVPIHLAQVITYLRLGGYSLGYILNFNVLHMRQGIKRVVV